MSNEVFVFLTDHVWDDSLYYGGQRSLGQCDQDPTDACHQQPSQLKTMEINQHTRTSKAHDNQCTLRRIWEDAQTTNLSVIIVSIDEHTPQVHSFIHSFRIFTCIYSANGWLHLHFQIIGENELSKIVLELAAGEVWLHWIKMYLTEIWLDYANCIV